MVTIVDIAKQAGVSHQVVSKVLHGGRSKVGAGPATRQQILRLAEELGYRPHAASQALRQRAFRSVGVLMNVADGFYLPQEALAALSQRLAAGDYTCTFVCTESFDAAHILDSRLLKARLVDLLIVSYVYELPPLVAETIKRIELPAVWLVRRADTDSVYLDEADGANQLVHHLAAQGQRRVAYVDYSSGEAMNPVLAERLRGLNRAARELGVDIQPMTWRQVAREDRFAATRDWLEPSEHPHAVIASSIASAQIILQTAKHLGRRVPEELAVATFDEGTMHLANVPTITCAVRSNIDFGVAAAEMALAKVGNPQVELPSRCLHYRVEVGGSTLSS